MEKRWQFNRPNSFIPVAEEMGIIIPIGRGVIEEACKTIREWRVKYNFVMPIAVNVASQHPADHDD